MWTDREYEEDLPDVLLVTVVIVDDVRGGLSTLPME